MTSENPRERATAASVAARLSFVAAVAALFLVCGARRAQALPTFPATVDFYVPVTLTNSQTTAVSSGTQVKLNVDWDTYIAVLSTGSPVTSVIFMDSNAVQIPAYIESCNGSFTSCSSTDTSSVVWVTIDSTIPASGNMTLYMGFAGCGTNLLSSGGLMGESPTLSSVYGQYDNGFIVFANYFNGTNSTTTLVTGANDVIVSSSNVTWFSGSSSTTITALYQTGYAGFDNNYYIDFMISTPSLSNVPLVVETNMMTTAPPTAQGVGSFCDQPTADTKTENAVGTDIGYGSSEFSLIYITGGTVTQDIAQTGTAVSNKWYYGATYYEGPSATAFEGYVSTFPYAAYTGTSANNPLKTSAKLYVCYTGVTDASYLNATYYNWSRVRIDAPNDVQPTAAFGALTTEYSTMIGTAANWTWAVPTATNTVPSGTPNSWTWGTWGTCTGRQIPQGGPSGWTWGNE